MKLTKIDLDSNRIVRTIAFNNCGFEEITDSVEGLVESIEDDELNSYLDLSYKLSDNITMNFGYNGRRKAQQQ